MINNALTAFVQELLPDARVESISLPDAAPLKLYLLNEDFPKGKLPNDVANKLMEQPFYWAFCWASGSALAELILKQPELVSGKRIVDFGCGSGVVAIAAALAGAKKVIACDIDPMALLAAKENAVLNNADISYSDDFLDVIKNKGQVYWDLIVAADVLYDRENMQWLDVFTKSADEVLLADSRVKNFSHPCFKKISEISSCTFPDLDESNEFKTVNIYIHKK
ncbi:MAG: 50S ribosomal protein L11 methyltransferase [Cellvibrionaceae bacterium]